MRVVLEGGREEEVVVVDERMLVIKSIESNPITVRVMHTYCTNNRPTDRPSDFASPEGPCVAGPE